MYELSFGALRTTVNTLADVLAHMNQRSTLPTDPRPAAADIVVLQNGKPLQVVPGRSGRYGVLQPGHSQEIFQAMFDEVDRAYLRPAGVVRRPHEMRLQEWEAVLAVGDAACGDLPCFSMDQRQLPCEAAIDGQAMVVSLSRLCDITFRQQCGWGPHGPAYDRQGQINRRHETHVAHALANGLDVPSRVLDDYLAEADPRRDFGMGKWFRILLEVPAMRGKMAVEKLAVLCAVLGREKIQITAENAPALITLMGQMPIENPTHVQMDDYLFAHQVLKVRDVDPASCAPADLSGSHSALALRIRDNIAQLKTKEQLAYLTQERQKGRISLRQFEHGVADAKCLPAREPISWGDKMAAAVENRDLPFLLEILDTPNDRNVSSKKAIQEHAAALKLLKLSAADRRRAIFLFCGYDDEKRHKYEIDLVRQSAAAATARARQEAIDRASSARWRMADGTIVSGKDYVDQSITAGYTEITTSKRGRATEYWISNPTTRCSKNLRVKDGTVDYARLCLETKRDLQVA